jgi:hypothetical protein
MPKVAIIKITSSNNDCYECGSVSKDLELINDYEYISDKDYSILKTGIENQKYNSPIRYMMLEQCSVDEVKEDLKSIINRFVKDKEEIDRLNLQRKQKEEKRLATLKKNREEKEKKQLEELKKKYEKVTG